MGRVSSFWWGRVSSVCDLLNFRSLGSIHMEICSRLVTPCLEARESTYPNGQDLGILGT